MICTGNLSMDVNEFITTLKIIGFKKHKGLVVYYSYEDSIELYIEHATKKIYYTDVNSLRYEHIDSINEESISKILKYIEENSNDS